jgi:hypothetical protein
LKKKAWKTGSDRLGLRRGCVTEGFCMTSHEFGVTHSFESGGQQF